ncbi:(R)-citramalyl-CoA lyase [Candidatus Phycosocius bacilliformis]|uniref:(R)-citramalyl-CoA lyase n=1 Tax=Candidatus Phycosocius bacilliformis TaxID=1445552 RepID=A0A2P2EA91_9PROT|nr:hydroxymethylglutaryl-CoA lyase [Candidatus Phycosocius bacilliformis]GBF57986.1 (R)-citramalyl-CoA lyase [Candidatus Phycosocius bacilliformis]
MTSIEIVEVGARDGLQNEPDILPTATKLQMINFAIAAGVRRIETASFVNPRRVPQMADAEDVMAGLPDTDAVTYIGLVLNERGAERALATKVHELGAVAVASDSFAMRNQGQTSAESVEVAKRIVDMAKAAGRSGQITISAAFGCPFDGEVDPDHVVAMAAALAEANPREIALADTIGVAVPSQVKALIGRVRAAIGTIPIRAHFHNTRNTGLANAWAALEAGAATLDSSLGGLGGCPFAPKATGNIPTEDLLYLLHRSGVATGIDLDAMIGTGQWLSNVMGRPLPAMLSRAGNFPPSPAHSGAGA